MVKYDAKVIKGTIIFDARIRNIVFFILTAGMIMLSMMVCLVG